MLINDVGQNTWEEINDGIAGSNYGWPDTEGTTTDPRFRVADLLVRARNRRDRRAARSPAARSTTRRRSSSRAATSATTSSPTTAAAGSASSIRRRGTRSRASRPGSPARSTSRSRATAASTTSPAARAAPSSASPTPRARRRRSRPIPRNQTVPAGGTATFTVAASGTPPLSYQWQRNGVDIAGATSASYSLASVHDRGQRRPLPRPRHEQRRQRPQQRGDADRDLEPGADRHDHAASVRRRSTAAARRSRTRARAPTRRTATLPASAFTWQVDFHHATHIHPFIAPTSGATSGSFVVPTSATPSRTSGTGSS